MVRTLYIYQSNSYTSYNKFPPNDEQIKGVKNKLMRIFKVEGNSVFGLKRNGCWKHIPDGSALRQCLISYGGVAEQEQE